MRVKSPLYESERLLLRPVRIEDALDMYEYSSDQALTQMAGFGVHESYEDTKKIIRRFFLTKIFHRQPESYAIIYKENKKMIGTIDLHDVEWQSKKAYLGYVINRQYWGRGLAKEASVMMLNYGFNVLDLELILVNHFVDNYQSQRVIEKLGFRYLKEQIDLERQKVIRHYEMTKEEYNEERNGIKI